MKLKDFQFKSVEEKNSIVPRSHPHEGVDEFVWNSDSLQQVRVAVAPASHAPPVHRDGIDRTIFSLKNVRIKMFVEKCL